MIIFVKCSKVKCRKCASCAVISQLYLYTHAIIHLGKSGGKGVRISEITTVRALAHCRRSERCVSASLPRISRIVTRAPISALTQVHFGAVSPALKRREDAGKAMPWRCFSFRYASESLYVGIAADIVAFACVTRECVFCVTMYIAVRVWRRANAFV